MTLITNSTRLIGACGLYCGACKKYQKRKCPGCTTLQGKNPQPQQPCNKWLDKCKIRRCCEEQGFHTCAECDKDAHDCNIYNNIVGRIFSFLFNSDRAACIRYICRNGEEAFAEKMTWDEQMTFRRK